MLVTTHSSVAEPLTLDVRPARLDDIYPILGLHREAFADKFGAAFGTHHTARGVEAMAEAWRRQGIAALRGMMVASVDERVIGTISLRTWEMGGENSGAAELAFHQVLGTWAAMRSIFTLSLLDHRIDRHEGYITDVAVLTEFRRRGVAQLLLTRVEQEARLRGKRFLGLYVSAANAVARHLYTINGFSEHRVRQSWMAGLLLHQRAWVYMRKELR